MFRQILIVPEHRKFQKILWRFSPSEEVQEYELNTVSYGVASSPYLALRVIQNLAETQHKNFPLASRALLNDVYVDDVITGCSSLEQAQNLRDELIALLKTGGFELRKWASNYPELLEAIPADARLDCSLNFDQDSDTFVKILGLRWDPTNDCFTYQIGNASKACSKRALLAELARIFDPEGFLAPVTFFAKRLIQVLWTLGLGWDDIPPEGILNQWSRYYSELPQLAKLRISRRLLPDNFQSSTLHAFADASEFGYAAVVYLKTVSALGNIDIKLVCAKSKVAPLKKLSIPRLELCAALLASKLIASTVSMFKELFQINGIYAYSDSTVVLAWLGSSPHKWKTFVSNRVAQIQDVIPGSSWHHVPSRENPADCASRGLTPVQLLSHSLWWAGPPFLHESVLPPESAQTVAETSSAVYEEERKIVLISEVDNDTISNLLNNCSSLAKIKCVIARCQRFVSNLRSKIRADNPWKESDLHDALMALVKFVQSQVYMREIDFVLSKNQKSLPKAFRKLAPFVDGSGLLRVGGRLKHSSLSFDAKHPILLLSKHRLTDLIIEDAHNRYHHPGPQTLHYLLIQQFWILGAKNAIRRITSRCYRCWRLNPKSLQPPMGDLP